MPRTPDRRSGPLYEEGIYLDDAGLQPEVPGEIRRDGDDVYAKDSVGVFNLRQGGSALPFEKFFSARLALVVKHNRGVRPLVQVLIPEIGGWNNGGWNEQWWGSGSGRFIRLSDEQYETTHINVNQFIIKFSEKTTGRVVYF